MAKNSSERLTEYISKREKEGVLFKWRDGKMFEFSQQAWDKLHHTKKAKFDGEVSDGMQDVIHHTPSQEKIPIDIQQDKIIIPTEVGEEVETQTTKEPIKDEPIADEPELNELDKLIANRADPKVIRPLLKEYFAKNNIEYNIRATTPKLIEFYESTKQKN